MGMWDVEAMGDAHEYSIVGNSGRSGQETKFVESSLSDPTTSNGSTGRDVGKATAARQPATAQTAGSVAPLIPRLESSCGNSAAESLDLTADNRLRLEDQGSVQM
jgi:hypothetical protein